MAVLQEMDKKAIQDGDKDDLLELAGQLDRCGGTRLYSREDFAHMLVEALEAHYSMLSQNDGLTGSLFGSTFEKLLLQSCVENVRKQEEKRKQEDEKKGGEEDGEKEEWIWRDDWPAVDARGEEQMEEGNVEEGGGGGEEGAEEDGGEEVAAEDAEETGAVEEDEKVGVVDAQCTRFLWAKVVDWSCRCVVLGLVRRLAGGRRSCNAACR